MIKQNAHLQHTCCLVDRLLSLLNKNNKIWMGSKNTKPPRAFPIHDTILIFALSKIDTAKNSIPMMDSNIKYFLFMYFSRAPIPLRIMDQISISQGSHKYIHIFRCSHTDCV